jgi:hypothetical protein
MWREEEAQRQLVLLPNLFIFIDFKFFTVPGSEWTKVIVAEYQAKIHSLGDEKTNPDAITKLFRPQIEWYRERLQANVRETRKSGKFDLTIGHYAKLVTKLVCPFFVLGLQGANYTSYSLSRYIKSLI